MKAESITSSSTIRRNGNNDRSSQYTEPGLRFNANGWLIHEHDPWAMNQAGGHIQTAKLRCWIWRAVGTNMKASVVNELPLSIYNGGRIVEDFAIALTPGYSPISSGPYGAVVNGGQWFTKDYTIDGTSGTASFQGNSMSGGPTMEAVQELQAQTSGLDAQSSITGGSVISFNLESGTNKFHGSAFLYGVNELLDANKWTNDYFRNRLRERPTTRSLVRQTFHQFRALFMTSTSCGSTGVLPITVREKKNDTCGMAGYGQAGARG